MWTSLPIHVCRNSLFSTVPFPFFLDHTLFGHFKAQKHQAHVQVCCAWPFLHLSPSGHRVFVVAARGLDVCRRELGAEDGGLGEGEGEGGEREEVPWAQPIGEIIGSSYGWSSEEAAHHW